jgi:16S rRNA (uracil1498-N3)-methyltransferase
VSPPLFLVEALPADRAGGSTVRLDGAEGHHAADVQRLRGGEPIVLADGRGAWGTARVSWVGRGALDAELEGLEVRPAPRPSVTVVQGIAKGDRGELAVQAMTEVGVDAIVPWAAARSVAKWRDDKPLRRWRATAREAGKQARRAWLPHVSAAESTAEVVRRLSGTALVLHEEARLPLSAVELPADGELVVVVGPEGGIAPEELAAFEAAGASAVRLGTSVLRTSTAGVAALAALSVRLGRW